MRPSRQARIIRQFEERSAWWGRVYEQTSLEARILRRCQQVALTWVEQLSRSYPGDRGSWKSAVAPRDRGSVTAPVSLRMRTGRRCSTVV